MSCWRCNEDEMVVVCLDDICRGQNYCMHGDGERPCPDCRAEGRDEDDDTHDHGPDCKCIRCYSYEVAANV